MSNIHHILKQHWSFDNFRAGQQEIIESILQQKDTLALLPTGGGKSVCYQVPGLLMEGVCVVVSPLIALMKDQVMQLKKREISAVAIYSGMSQREIQNVFDNAHFGKIKFIYFSPERLQQPLFREQLSNLKINFLAVDEAHCISQWGYDFRPPYLQIANIRNILPNIPILALTATATPEVQKDICEKLELKNPAIFLKSFARHNLSYVVRKDETKQNKLLEVLRKIKGSSIVYVRNRRMTKLTAEWLNQNKIKTDFYHAGLTAKERDQKQERWMKNQTHCIVCTNAFGMGIDKPDVRCVVHLDLPDSPEAYFQEAGRAGRDEKNSFVVLIWNDDDVRNLEQNLVNSYPSIDEIKRVYEALMHYLQIPIGSGTQQFYDFNLNELIEKFNLNQLVTFHSLKILEQHNFITLSDGVLIPSTIKIIAKREDIYRFEVENKKMEPVLKALLRIHSGLRDNYVELQEKKMCSELNCNEKRLNEFLLELKRLELIDYSPIKDKPQIILQQPRVKLDNLIFDNAFMQKLQIASTHRTTAMIGYAKNNSTCRSNYLLSYFGEENLLPCGKCDVCIELRKKKYSAELLHKIYGQLKSQFESRPFQINDVLNLFHTHSKQDVMYYLEWLLNEEKLKKEDTFLRLK